MKLRPWNSITTRLLIALVFFNLVLVVTITYVNTRLAKESYMTHLELTIRQQSDLLMPSLAEKIVSGDRAQLKAVLEKLSRSHLIDRIVVTSKSLGIITVGPEVMESPLLVGSSQITDNKGEVLGTIRMEVSDEDYQALMQRYLTLLAAMIAAYLLMLYLVTRAILKLFRPLQDLTTKLEGFDPGNPQPIAISLKGTNEITMIAEAAHKMSDNIIHHSEFMRQLHEEIKEGQQHLKEAQQIARMGSWQVDPETGEGYFSDQMHVLMGCTPNEDVNWNMFIEIIDEKERHFIINAVENTIKSHTPFRLMHMIHNVQGESLHVLTEAKMSQLRNGKLVVSGISMDVTEQTESQKMIEKLAFYDPLTNLPNRLLLHDRLAKAIKDARRRREKVGILFLDLDRFKNVNDTLGHTMGDMLLKGVADRLGQILRETDTISRIGGDEFVVLLPMISSADDARKVAIKMLDALQEKWKLGDKELYTTTSIGVALCPDHADDADTLIKYADTAMYRSKEEGRNRYQMYDSSMGDKIARALLLENEMRLALQEMEQFELYYQPKISLRNGAVVGAEALIRWNHAEMGMIYPDAFIPIAENTGMIIAMGEWIMHEAARRIEGWKKAGIAPLKIAVNLSGRQFASPLLLDQIRTVLHQYEINPKYLEFEVTESVSMLNMEESLQVLQQLRTLGVGVAIDDFGTGYSSLAYLKQFPVDTLKIDKAFIFNMLKDQDDLTIVETIVSMSKAMDLKVTAEGVETVEHVRMLKKIGVDFGQGYFFSRPIPFARFDMLYRQSLVRMKERRETQKASG